MRIVVSSSMVRLPLAGIHSFVLQYLIGFEMLGYGVFYIEKANYDNACCDPHSGQMSDDCTSGVTILNDLLKTHGLENRWGFIDCNGKTYGKSLREIHEVLRTADIFLDMGNNGSGAWMEEAEGIPVRVLYEGEPGYAQIVMERRRISGENIDEYDFYYSVGSQIGTTNSTAPTAGQKWRHLGAVVATDLISPTPAPPDGAFTSVMTWKSHKELEFEGETYGQKDLEFEKFIALPRLVNVPMEVRVTGSHVPMVRLRHHGWRIPEMKSVTQSMVDYHAYIRQSAGEFSVAKNVFVKTRCGWIGDRSGTYLASGRPVVLQDTGFSNHLPCGEGLFAVNNVDEAVEAIARIKADPVLHSKAARRIAVEHLDAKLCLSRFLEELSGSPQ